MAVRCREPTDVIRFTRFTRREVCTLSVHVHQLQRQRPYPYTHPPVVGGEAALEVDRGGVGDFHARFHVLLPLREHQGGGAQQLQVRHLLARAQMVHCVKAVRVFFRPSHPLVLFFRVVGGVAGLRGAEEAVFVAVDH